MIATLYRALVIATYNLHLLVAANGLLPISQSNIAGVGYINILSNDNPLEAPKFNVGHESFVLVFILYLNWTG